MCFGSKDERDDEPAPRPHQQAPAQRRSSDMKKASAPSPTTAAAASGGVVTDYAPPSGPPPPQQQQKRHDDFVPPSGPPPAARPEEYAAPSGPPPGAQPNDYAPPSGPPPGAQPYDYAAPSGPPPAARSDDYAPPSGPPPASRRDEYAYAPPSGPPPAGQMDDFAPPSGPPPSSRPDDFAPPPGPPPPQQRDEYAPPPGPPPAINDWTAVPPLGPPPPSSKPPVHDWEIAVPDTTLFPPPPAIFSGFDRSPATNAPEAEADAGDNWCEQYQLTPPIVLDTAGKAALKTNNVRLMEPMGFNGKLTWLSSGRWQAQTNKNSPDRCIISYPPLYLVSEHDPNQFKTPRTIYYEVKIHANSPGVSIAMGFSALPYPSFRMPGWHRASLAVHGDDGHKYINDGWGGKTFTDSFKQGDTYGIGMILKPTGDRLPQVDIIFTRNGVLVDGWDLHEETDADQDLPVTGLEGLHDLCCSIGTYDGLSFDVIFDPSQWMYKGVQ